jgi:peptide/nickel transport system ATP-binding protein
MELGTADAVFGDMRHPYTQALLESIPDADLPSHTRLQPIPGRPPDLLNPPVGCAFAARCRYAQPECLEVKPRLDGVEGHQFACYHPVNTPEGEAALAANRVAGVTAAGLDISEAEGELV